MNMRRIAVLLLCALLASCTTGSDKAARDSSKQAKKQAKAGREKPAKKRPEKEAKKGKKKDPLADANPAPNVTFSQSAGTLGDTIGRLSEEVGGSLVLMNGIEGRRVDALAFKDAKFSTVVERLAEMTRCKCQAFPDYWFMYLEGYEPVLDVTVAGKLDPAYAQYTAGMAFGPETPLYGAFALLGDSLGITIVADNIVAEARCGALTLARIPLRDGLDALLKSARLLPTAFQVESTPEYIFLFATQNVTPASALLNPETLTPDQNALLDKKVDVALPAPPEDPQHSPMVIGATPLAKVLDTLSASLGVKVGIEPGLDDLPVNPCALHQVRVRTAMDLLIRQWYQPEFGYRLSGGQIIIERRK
jgi:hypothetical protein